MKVKWERIHGQLDHAWLNKSQLEILLQRTEQWIHLSQSKTIWD